MSEQPTPRTDAAVARAEHRYQHLYPHLPENPVHHTDMAKLELELAEATRIRSAQAETIRQLRAEAAEWTTDGELVNKAHKLERELAQAKDWREVAEGMTKWKDDLLRERDQWREVAEGLHKIVEEYWEPDWESTPENKRNVLDLYDKLKEQQ